MNKKEIKYNSLPPFKGWCLANFPYIEEDFDALTNYQLFSKVVEYLNKMNINQQAFNNEINTLFDNLEEDVNNKLDEWVEDGTFDKILSQYITENVIYSFNTVSDMKAANLIANQTIKTLGYYNINDGGSAYYKIVEEEPATGHYETLNNNLYAYLIIDKDINPLSWGAYGDGIHDDYSILQKCINFGNVKLIKGSYLLSEMIVVPSNRIFDGNECTLIPSSGNYAIGIKDPTEPTQQVNIKNLIINCSQNAGSNGLYLESGYFIYVDNINIRQLTGNNAIGIKQINGFNIIIQNSRIFGSALYNDQIGIDISTINSSSSSGTSNMTNNRYDTLLIQNVGYGIKANYKITANTISFQNIGFSNNDYSFYIRGFIYPVEFKSIRIESGSKTSQLIGFDLNGTIYADFTNLNIYNIPICFNFTGVRSSFNGAVALSGTNQTTKYIAFQNLDYPLINNGKWNVQSNTYNLMSSTTLSNYGVFRNNNKSYLTLDATGNTINTVLSETQTYKLTQNLVNVYGFKGSEIYVYATSSGIRIMNSSNSTTSLLNDIVDMIPNQLYHIILLENSKFTIIN